MEIDLDNLASFYLRHYRSANNDEDFWAWQEVHRLVHDDLDAGWNVTLLLLEKTESDDEVGYVAAGPLEDLIDIHGHKALDRIEEVSDNNPPLQLALSTVGVLFYYEEFERWYGLLCRYGFRKGDLADSPAIITAAISLMDSCLNQTISAGEYCRALAEILQKPLHDKAAQRILQGASWDAERYPNTLKGAEFITRVRQSFAELESLGYWAVERRL